MIVVCRANCKYKNEYEDRCSLSSIEIDFSKSSSEAPCCNNHTEKDIKDKEDEPTINFRLDYISNNCYNWNTFCNDTGISYYACNEGFGHSTIDLSISKAKEYGLV